MLETSRDRLVCPVTPILRNARSLDRDRAELTQLSAKEVVHFHFERVFGTKASTLCGT